MPTSLAPSPPPTRPLVAPLAESRPAAQRWCTDPLPGPSSAQPPLDLRPVPVPLVPASPADLAHRSADPGLPGAGAWSVALAVTLLEVVAARRPGSQLSRWLTQETLDALARRLPSRRALPVATPALQSVRVQHPRPGVAEVAVHGRLGDRSLPMALRLEALPTRWLCTALELGPLP